MILNQKLNCPWLYGMEVAIHIHPLSYLISSETRKSCNLVRKFCGMTFSNLSALSRTWDLTMVCVGWDVFDWHDRFLKAWWKGKEKVHWIFYIKIYIIYWNISSLIYIFHIYTRRDKKSRTHQIKTCEAEQREKIQKNEIYIIFFISFFLTYFLGGFTIRKYHILKIFWQHAQTTILNRLISIIGKWNVMELSSEVLGRYYIKV